MDINSTNSYFSYSPSLIPSQVALNDRYFQETMRAYCLHSSHFEAAALLQQRVNHDPSFDPISFIFEQQHYQLAHFLISNYHHAFKIAYEQMQQIFCYALIQGRKEMMEFAATKIDLNATFPMTPNLQLRLNAQIPLPLPTPLYLAISLGKKRAVKWLIESRAAINLPIEKSVTPLHYACCLGQIEIAQSLIEAGGNIHAKDHSGSTPLHIATACKLIEMIDFLLLHGADSNSKTVRGETPLHLACNVGDLEIAKRLVQARSQIEAKDAMGCTPLHMAASYGHYWIVKFLIELGAGADCQDDHGATPLHLACELGYIEIAHHLIQAANILEVKDKNGRTPLYYAIAAGREDGVNFLIEQGAVINNQEEQGKTPLHIACQHGFPRIVKRLIQTQADINARDHSGYTPLYQEVANQHMEMVFLLLSLGADSNCLTNRGSSPLQLACSIGNMQMAEGLIQAKAILDAKNEMGFTALHLAAMDGHQEIITLLLSKGAEVNHQTTIGITALHIACQKGHFRAAQSLIGNGADRQARSEFGHSPLDLAIAHGKEELVSLFPSFADKEHFPRVEANSPPAIEIIEIDSEETDLEDEEEIELKVNFNAPLNADLQKLLKKKKALEEQGLDWEHHFLSTLQSKLNGANSPSALGLRLQKKEIDLIFADLAFYQIDPNSYLIDGDKQQSLLKIAYLLGKIWQTPYVKQLIEQEASWIDAVRAESPLKPQSALFTLIQDLLDTNADGSALSVEERRELYQLILLDTQAKADAALSWKVELLAHLVKNQLAQKEVQELLALYENDSPIPFLEAVILGKSDFPLYAKVIERAFAEIEESEQELSAELQTFQAALSSLPYNRKNLLEAKKRMLEVFPPKRKREELLEEEQTNRPRIFVKGSFPTFEAELKQWLKDLSSTEADLALEAYSEQVEKSLQSNRHQIPAGIDINHLLNHAAKKYLKLFFKRRNVNLHRKDPDRQNPIGISPPANSGATRYNLKATILKLIQSGIKERLEATKVSLVSNTSLESLAEIESRRTENDFSLGKHSRLPRAKKPRLYYIFEETHEKTVPPRAPLPSVNTEGLSRQECERLRGLERKQEMITQNYMKQSLEQLRAEVLNPSLSALAKKILEEVIETKEVARRNIQNNPLLNLAALQQRPARPSMADLHKKRGV
ncbi:MAG: uncharacterized protein K0S07_1242 [Chlamydiales bacterium]|jgi:ankyrin repeat protein|nr:uncharacterized protein [Chlamydiales bacterium]